MAFYLFSFVDTVIHAWEVWLVFSFIDSFSYQIGVCVFVC